MRQAILTLNIGSSSLKFAVYEIRSNNLIATPIVKGQIAALEAAPHFKVFNQLTGTSFEENWPAACYEQAQAKALANLLQWLSAHLLDYTLVAVGHRIVHGANQFTQAVIVTAQISTELARLIPLAPLHQKYNLAGIDLLGQQFPQLVQVACFDTAFHTTQSELSQAFALPAGLGPYPIKRYGFHGLSYEYIAGVLPQYLGEKAEQKIIVAHLGHGASLCALEQRKSVASTMGFTALDGLPMGTRCGNLDPGVVLYLLEQQQMSISAVTDLLYNRAGLLGVSQVAADMRSLLESEAATAKFAIELFAYRVVREIGSLMAALGGIHALVFTAGIGEHVAVVREKICQQLAWLDLKLDASANQQHQIQISTPESKVSVWVIPTNEEWIIAHHTWQLWNNKPLN